jgi:hypothetical protein
MITLNLEIRAGEDFRFSFEAINANSVPINLTGWGADLQVRASRASSAVAASLTVGSGITFADNTSNPPVHSIVQVHFTPAQTEAMYAAMATGGYDLRLTDPLGLKSFPVEGNITMFRSYTR